MIPLEMMHAKKFMNQNSYGFDCERVVGHKRKHGETISGCKRKKILGGTRMSNPGNKRVKGSVGIPDQDYLKFLELISGSEKSAEEETDVTIIDDEDDSVDPQYKIFLENLRKDGDVYVLEMKKADGTVDVVRYEEGEELREGGKNGGSDKGKEKEVNETVGKEKEVNEMMGKEKEVNEKVGKEKEANVTVEPKVEVLEGGEEDLDGGFLGRNILSDCPPELVAVADRNYLDFLKNVWVKDSSLFYVHGNVIQNLEEDIGVEIGPKIPRQSHSSKKFTPQTDPGTSKMVANESDSDSIEILDADENIDYEGVLLKELKEVLQKPFDPKEYMDKLEDAKTRKPLQKSRIMRGRVVSYPTNETSPSYLDLHSDLRNMFNRAMQENDPVRALALLRCLFFYYRNVSHPGSFVPWRCPLDWLHDIICSCVDINCSMKNASKLYEEL